jgi:hypothetical protein
MKQIKFLIAAALVSVFAFSCKEAPKEEAVEEVVVEETAPVVEEVEVAVDTTAAAVEEVVEEVQQ